MDIDWVIGHLGSALPAGSLQAERAGGLARALHTVLDELDPDELIEEVKTTAVIGRLAS